MVRHVPLPVLWHMVALPSHIGGVEVTEGTPTVPVLVALGTAVVGGAVVRVGDGGCTVADGLGQAPPPPGRPVMVRVYAGHPALAVTSLTTTAKADPAGTLNEYVSVGLGLLPLSPTQLVHMLAGLKVGTYAPTKMKLVAVHAVFTFTVTQIADPLELV